MIIPNVRQARTALFLLTAVGTVNFIDRQILSVLAESIKRDLLLSDTQLGLLTGLSFALFYSILGIPAAMFADRTHRIRLISAACVMWSLFTGLCGFATNFIHLAAARFGVGVGEAGGNAPSLSVISDYYPPQKRAAAIGLFNLGGPIGIFLGASAGGWVGAHYGWRVVFFGLAALGVVVATVLLLSVREPARGALDANKGPTMTLRATAAYFLANPALRRLLLACGLAAFVNYGLLNWIPAYLMRVQHMPLTDVARWFGPAAGLSMGLGIWGGGALVSVASKRSERAFAYIPGVSLLLVAPTLALALTAASWQASLALLMIPMVCFTMYIAPALALVQNHAPPQARATATSLLLLAFNILGLGLGPLCVGLLSDYFAAHQADQPLRSAIACLVPVAVIGALAYYALSRALSAQNAYAIPQAPESS